MAKYDDTNTSFSATIFLNTAEELTLAIKGTLEDGDFAPTDADIALDGAGYDQIVAMANWWLRVIAEPGTMVSQFDAVGSFVFAGGPAPAASLAEGNLFAELNNNPGLKLNVIGHSLGAHLALALHAIFPKQGRSGYSTGLIPV